MEKSKKYRYFILPPTNTLRRTKDLGRERLVMEYFEIGLREWKPSFHTKAKGIEIPEEEAVFYL